MVWVAWVVIQGIFRCLRRGISDVVVGNRCAWRGGRNWTEEDFCSVRCVNESLVAMEALEQGTRESNDGDEGIELIRDLESGEYRYEGMTDRKITIQRRFRGWLKCRNCGEQSVEAVKQKDLIDWLHARSATMDEFAARGVIAFFRIAAKPRNRKLRVCKSCGHCEDL